MLASPKAPLSLENPAPKEISPVERSFTDTSTIVLSRADPALFSISTRSKKPKLRIRVRVRLSFDVLKASPSKSNTSRRITSSKVRTFPEILTNSTKTFGPSWIPRKKTAGSQWISSSKWSVVSGISGSSRLDPIPLGVHRCPKGAENSKA